MSAGRHLHEVFRVKRLSSTTISSDETWWTRPWTADRDRRRCERASFSLRVERGFQRPSAGYCQPKIHRCVARLEHCLRSFVLETQSSFKFSHSKRRALEPQRQDLPHHRVCNISLPCPPETFLRIGLAAAPPVRYSISRSIHEALLDRQQGWVSAAHPTGVPRRSLLIPMLA